MQSVVNAPELSKIKKSVQYIVTKFTGDQVLGHELEIDLLQSVINASVLELSVKKRLYNNVSPPVNTETDSSTLVMSDTSFLAKSRIKLTGEDLGKQNYSKLLFQVHKLFKISFVT